jgi:hypothetical protein
LLVPASDFSITRNTESGQQLAAPIARSQAAEVPRAAGGASRLYLSKTNNCIPGLGDGQDYASPDTGVDTGSEPSAWLGGWESHKAEEREQYRESELATVHAYAYYSAKQKAAQEGKPFVPPARKQLSGFGGRLKHRAAETEERARAERPTFSFPAPSPEEEKRVAAGISDAERLQWETAAAMAKRGLVAKAKRHLHCGRVGARLRCLSFETGQKPHRFYRPFDCKCRYCKKCGPKIFRQYFVKYIKRLCPVVEALVERGSVVAKLDFTTINHWRMPTPEMVKAFNGCIKRFARLLERRLALSRRDYGLLYCDEFGRDNTNLHAHAMYVGPRLPRPRRPKKGRLRPNDGLLSELWRDACQGTVFRGSKIISVKRAESFEKGLAHALKYAGKFLPGGADRLAALEEAFDGVRRVHTLASFYRVPRHQDEDKENDLACPLCGGALERVGPMSFVVNLRNQGYLDLEDARRQIGRGKIFAGPRGSP